MTQTHTKGRQLLTAVVNRAIAAGSPVIVESRDTGHLVALTERLSLERNRLAFAKGAQEIALRKVWVAQCEKEVAGEMKFLGISHSAAPTISDDDLLAELQS